MTQLATTAEGFPLPNTPPPAPVKLANAVVAPPRNVKPLRIAVFVIHTQRIALVPFVEVGSQAP